MRYPPAFIDEIKYRCDIHDVISSYVTLKRAGANYSGLCPFHSEKTPSFTVFPASSSFYCFGCGAGGDVITFVMKSENLDYPAAVEMLAARAGIPVPAQSKEEKSVRLKRERFFQMNKEAARFFHRCLKEPVGESGLRYLEKRGIGAHGINHFGLGFAPADFGMLRNHMRTLGYTEEELLAGFLCGRSKKSGKLYDMFRNRVMFPLIDTAGNVVAFSGRTLDPDEERKYINSSDTPVFKKSRQLFALNFARQHCRDCMILCEGPMDTISLHLAGFENAVATQGTAITPEHARLIAKYTQNVVIAYDNDDAGQRAAKKAIRLLEEVGLNIRVLQMQGAKDPDEYIKKYGADKFRALLSQSMGQQDYMISSVLKKYDITLTEDRLKAAEELTTQLAQIPSAVRRDVFTGKVAQALGISRAALEDDIRRVMRRNDRKFKQSEMQHTIQAAQGIGDRTNPDAIKNRKAARAEEQILGILLYDPELMNKTQPDAGEQSALLLREEDFFTSFHRKLFACMRQVLEENGSFQISYLGEYLSDEEMGRATQLMVKRRDLQNDEIVLAECIASLHEATRAADENGEGEIDMDELNRMLSDRRRKGQMTEEKPQ